METYVEFKHISKYFPGVKALDDICFKAESGEVYAFLGENGAGKSTLLKVLNGDYQPDEGEYIIDGQARHFSSPQEAIAAGVSVIYQERQILMEMTVAENVFLGSWIRKNGTVDFETMNRRTREIAGRFGLQSIEPDAKVGTLSIAHQQMVEIMKAVNRDSRIIAFDEPTASLSDNEIEILFRIIRELQAEKKIIFYVSHRMNEIEQIAQKVVVFKDGKTVALVEREKVSNDELIRMMVGRPLGSIFDSLPRNGEFGEVVLEVKNLTTAFVKDISFQIRRGEILGFSGLVGSGRTEIMRAIFGVDKVMSGEIRMNGKTISPRSPKQAVDLGIALVPEDRKEQGILPNISVRGNITVSMLRSYCNGLGILDEAGEQKTADADIKKFNIKTPDSEKLIAQLSGGNQQKVILARWLETKPQVLILDEPTKGIDVGAKSEFYKIICECARDGIAVIVISSELPEIIGLSDRVIVVREGRISGEILRTDATEEHILAYAMTDKTGERAVV